MIIEVISLSDSVMIEVILLVVDDKNLPCVPPISVKIPELYPQVSPQCDTKTQDYGKWAVLFILKKRSI